jgi:hypothetical protein
MKKGRVKCVTKEMTKKKALSVKWVAAVVVLLVVVVGIVAYPSIDSALTLRWSIRKVLSSPESSMKYTQVVLGEALKTMPEHVLKASGNGYSGEKTIEAWIKDISQYQLPSQVKLISEAKRLARQGAPIELEWIPDRHPFREVEAPEVVQQEIEQYQKNHIDYINKTKPEIVFAEGIYKGRISSESLMWDQRESAKTAGVSVTDEELEKANAEDMKAFWWRDFVDKEKPRLFGIEERNIVSLGTFLIAVNWNEIKSARLEQMNDLFQFYWREQIILANIITTLREEGASKATLVLGEAHEKTLLRLCKKWGVKLTVVR